MIKFGEYLPDQSPLENAGLVDCQNILPSSQGYTQLPAPVRYSSNALDGQPKGGISVRDTTTNSAIYTYVGTTDKLYQLSGNTFTDVSKVGGYSTAAIEYWEFVIWNSQIIATNFSNPMQIITIGGGNFADLGGTPPQARHLAIVGNFLVVGNTYDAVDLYQPARVRWAGIGTTTSWTVDPTTQADFNDLKNDGGQIQKIVGGEFGLIFQQECITRMSYIGSPLVFQFDLVESARGALTPNGIVKIGDRVAFLAQDGFFVFDGQQSIPIGDAKVDETFFQLVNLAYLDNMSVALYPTENIICWSFVSINATGQMPDIVFMYNYSPNSTQRWSYALINTWLLLGPISQSYTLDGLDAVSTNIDALPNPPPNDISLDSPVWMGLIRLLGTFDSNFYLNLMNGAPMDATLTTGEAWLDQPYRSYLTQVRPHIDRGTNVTVQIGTRTVESQAATFSSAVNLNSQGYAPVRVNSRLMRAKFNMTGGFQNAQGFDVVINTSAGRR